jgi:hypothetical protein
MHRFIASSLVALALGASVAADQTSDVLDGLKKALGGSKLSELKTLTAEGTYRRTMGEREMNGDFELVVAMPDKFQRIEQFTTPSGMPGPRLATTVNGDQAWMGPLGPMPAGMMMNFGGQRTGGPGGPGAPGRPGEHAGPGAHEGANRPAPPDPSVRIRTEVRRVALALLPGIVAANGLTFTHAGVAKSPDGEADILEAKGSDDFVARVFVDREQHLPLMVTYMDRDPTQMGRMMNVQARPGESPEDRRKRMEEERQKMAAQGPPPPPPRVEIAWYVSDHKKVDGILLPHRLTMQVGEKVVQEWEFKKFKINGKVDLEQFNRKSTE